MSHLQLKVAFLRYKQGRIDAPTLAAYAALDAGLPLPGTESPANRRECSARTAALARHSKHRSAACKTGI